MPEGQSLEFSGVTKRFGAVTAVSGLTARVEPGRVTGFLGPNGAGKTTTLRILLGLVRATEGHATIGGKRYDQLDRPLQTVGAVLEASSFHPGRTAAAHLTIYAQAAGIAKARVGDVLDLVGLTDAANRKVGGFSLGMRQRLGLAYALLGDPGVLVLDEPANGLDPEGIRWMRGFLRQLAGEGRTVLVSSHLLAEVQQTVDALLIISRGRLVFQGSIDELTDPDEHATVVDAPDRAALAAALETAGVPFEVLRSGLTVRGVDPAAVGAAAAAAGVALSSLHRRGPALEEVFLDLVNGARVHASAAGGVGGLSQVPGTDAAAPAHVAATAAAGAGVVAASPEPGTAEPEPEHGDPGRAEAEESALTAAEPEHGDPSQAEAEESALTAAEPEHGDPDQAEAEESALAAAELDAEASGAPGAAASLAAATGAAWAAESRQAEEPGEQRAEAGDSPESVATAEPDESADAGATAEQTPAVAEAAGAAPVAYAVASTGVIDVVPAAGHEPRTEPESFATSATEEDEAAEDARAEHDATAGDAGTAAAAASAAWVGQSGEAEAPEDDASSDPWAPEDADPDVDALGAIDDELSTPEPADADDDRPWEHYVKTDSDLEADAFFAAFDADGNPRPDPEPGDDPGSGTSAGPESGAEAEPDTSAEPEPEPEAWVPPEAAAFEDAVGPGAVGDAPEARDDEGGDR